MGFNALEDNDPVRYKAFVSSLVDDTSTALKAAKGDDAAIRSAIHAFIARGYKAALTSGELTDFFCVDTPNVLDRAGLSNQEAEQAVKVFDEINEELQRGNRGHGGNPNAK